MGTRVWPNALNASCKSQTSNTCRVAPVPDRDHTKLLQYLLHLRPVLSQRRKDRIASDEFTIPHGCSSCQCCIQPVSGETTSPTARQEDALRRPVFQLEVYRPLCCGARPSHPRYGRG